MENEDDFILFWGALYISEMSSSFTILIFRALKIQEKSSLLTTLF